MTSFEKKIVILKLLDVHLFDFDFKKHCVQFIDALASLKKGQNMGTGNPAQRWWLIKILKFITKFFFMVKVCVKVVNY